MRFNNISGNKGCYLVGSFFGTKVDVAVKFNKSSDVLIAKPLMESFGIIVDSRIVEKTFVPCNQSLINYLSKQIARNNAKRSL